MVNPEPVQVQQPSSSPWKLVALYIYSVIINLAFLTACWYAGVELLKVAPETMPYLVSIIIVVVPLTAATIIFLFFPLITSNKYVVWIVALLTLVTSHILFTGNITFTYFFPQLLVLIAFYAIYFVVCILSVQKTGEQLSARIRNWLKLQQQAASVNVSQPTGFIAKAASESGFFIFILLALFITLVSASLWGIGVFEVKSTFTDDTAFQKAVAEKFFTTDALRDFKVDNYTKTATANECLVNLPRDISQNFWTGHLIKEEFQLSENGKTQPFFISTMTSACNLESITLSKEVVAEGTFIYHLSDTYFNTKYPGHTSVFEGKTEEEIQADALLSSIKNSMAQDKKKTWLRKGDTMLCTNIEDKTQQEKYIALLQAFKSSELDTSKCK